MNVMVVAPHPDDESIGCGGSVVQHVRGGDRVTVVWVTSGELGIEGLGRAEAARIREAEAEAAAAALGVTDYRFLRLPDSRLDEVSARLTSGIAGVVAEVRPSVVYVPHAEEAHPDHAACYSATLASLSRESVSLSRASGGAAGDSADVSVWGYEVWTPSSHYDMVSPIDAEMEAKLRAICCHESQLGRFAFDRAAEGLGAYRGALAGGCRYAEVFTWGLDQVSAQGRGAGQ